jgi:transposase
MMLLPSSVRIYLAVEPVDLRRGHDGLGAIVRAQFGKEELFGGHLFVFLGRRLDRCKILYWDLGGFVLYYKRLERGRFRRPHVPADATSVPLDATALAMLLDGIDLAGVRRPDLWHPKT